LSDTTPRTDPSPSGELFLLLRRMAHLMEPHDHEGVVASLSEVLALGQLACGPVSQQELADRLGLEKSTVSRLAAGLEKRGWLSRERDEANRRVYRLRLTEAGGDAVTRITAHLEGSHDRILAALTDQERAGLTLGLAGLARVMDDLPPRDGRQARHLHG
jgi:DNA-binding MarR family transcriptional regulator